MISSMKLVSLDIVGTIFDKTNTKRQIRDNYSYNEPGPSLNLLFESLWYGNLYFLMRNSRYMLVP